MVYHNILSTSFSLRCFSKAGILYVRLHQTYAFYNVKRANRSAIFKLLTSINSIVTQWFLDVYSYQNAQMQSEHARIFPSFTLPDCMTEMADVIRLAQMNLSCLLFFILGLERMFERYILLFSPLLILIFFSLYRSTRSDQSYYKTSVIW